MIRILTAILDCWREPVVADFNGQGQPCMDFGDNE